MSGAEKIVLVGGKFNRIHEGHLHLLKKAKSLGRLVVVIAHDTHNGRSYAMPAEERKKNMESLGIADVVFIGDPVDYSKVVDKFHPDIIVLGYDQSLPPNTNKKIKSMGIKIVKLEKYGNYSTKDMK